MVRIFNCPYIAIGSSQPSCLISESFISFYTDISMEHHSRVGEGPVLPLLLVLGFINGYSIWQILVRDHSLIVNLLLPTFSFLHFVLMRNRRAYRCIHQVHVDLGGAWGKGG